MARPNFIIDFDSTLVTVESLDELAGIALQEHPGREQIVTELGRITKLGMTGKLSFERSLHSRLELFSATRGHVDELTDLLEAHISPSALDNSDWFAAHREQVYVVSGGFGDYIEPVARRLGLLTGHVFANKFTYDAAGNITGHDPDNLLSQAHGKARQVAELGLPGPVIAIGDGFTDYEIRAHGAADEFWAFTETVRREGVVAQADRVLPGFHGDLHSLL